MGADEGARCQQLPSLVSPHPSLGAEQTCHLPTPLWRAELLHAVKTGLPPQSQGFPSSCRSLGWTKTDISHCPRDLVTWTRAGFLVPGLGDTINPVQVHLCWHHQHPACEDPPPPHSQGSLVDADQPTSPPLLFQMFLHPRPDVASIPSPGGLILGANTPPTSYQFHAQ